MLEDTRLLVKDLMLMKLKELDQCMKFVMIMKLMTKKNFIIEQLLLSEPNAIKLSKRRSLIEAGLVLSEEKFHELVEEHSKKRMSDEAYEGLMSFTEKRNPKWYKS